MPQDKIKVATITFLRKEGPIDHLPARLAVSNWTEANRQLSAWSASAPRDGCYNKTAFKITWADGEVYEGRYDLQHWSVEEPDLAKHVRDFLMFYAGQRCPGHMTTEEYEAYVGRQPETMATCATWLTKYSLEDSVPEVPAPAKTQLEKAIEALKEIAAMPTESEKDISNDDALNAMNDAINTARAALEGLL